MAKESKKLHNAFTDEHLEIIKKVYPDTPNKVIATMIPHSATSISKKAHTMGLKKTKEHISKNGRAIAIAQWNKLIENNLQLSSIRNINNYNEIKYKNHKWMALARYNWEQVHGPVPNDMCVFKIDQDKYNDDISNLCLVSRKDLAMLNRNHAKLTPELKEVQILINQIKQKIR